MTPAVASFTPQQVTLKLYAGDGAALRLTVTDPDGAPLPLTGTVTAQIRAARYDPQPLAAFAVTVNVNVATLTLTGPQTAALGQLNGSWDCQWTPPAAEPVTLVQGQATCSLDVTRA